MTDRELLELAAKAAGFEKDWQWGVHWLSAAGGSVKQDHSWVKWNPLTDDGDALRLAVKLELGFERGPGEHSRYVRAYQYGIEVVRAPISVVEDVNDDPYAATRRAVVRAAAEIGRSMA